MVEEAGEPADDMTRQSQEKPWCPESQVVVRETSQVFAAGTAVRRDIGTRPLLLMLVCGHGGGMAGCRSGQGTDGIPIP